MTTLTWTKLTMPSASLGKANPLPDMRSSGDAHAKIAVDEQTISPHEAKYIGWERINTTLPYLTLDGYNRIKRPKAWKAAVLENNHLRAVFLPELGGRLWSLFDKMQQRELLHVNPVFQPCNLALRNAWISGGVEWNVGIIGHTPFTVDDMCCEELSLSDGTPVLRMFQYERIRHLFFRIEAALPQDSTQLFIRIRIDNAHKEDTAVYWWSNMAVDEKEDVRVVVPADQAFHYGYGGKLSKINIPYITAPEHLLGCCTIPSPLDISRTTGIPQAMDFFFDVWKHSRPFIAALDKNGYGICQTSTQNLRGRKLFVWGMGTGGRHWQEFLSQKNSAYFEIQSGLAKTQLEHLPMKAGESISWLESYGPLHATPDLIHGSDWPLAVSDAAKALDQQMPSTVLHTFHERLKHEIDNRCGTVKHKGAGFARAEKHLLKDEFNTSGLSLSAMKSGADEEFWLQLAQNKSLSCPSPLSAPRSYAIGIQWEVALRRALEKPENRHWYAYYQLGVICYASNKPDDAHSAFLSSYHASSNPWALRCLALIQAQTDPSQAVEMLCKAASMVQCLPLYLEALGMLHQTKQYKRIIGFIKNLPRQATGSGRVKTFLISALMRTGQHKEAGKLLNGSIVLTDVREGDTLLSELWFELKALELYGNATLSSLDLVRKTLIPPAHLDFRMKSL